MQTSNLLSLAQDGFRFVKRLRNGLYVGQPGKRGSTHRLRAIWAKPRFVTKDVPKGVIRLCYTDPAQFYEFPNTEEGREQAAAKLAQLKELAKGATPYSAVTIPFGRRYKNFAAERAEAAAQGSLYTKTETASNMSKKPTPPAKKGSANKDSKNGITRPKEGSTTRKVWDIADRLGADRAGVLKEAAKRNINPATATTQYGKWRKYHGMEGRTAVKKAAKKKPSPPKAKPTPPPAS